jgi:hypothetical protein
VTKAGLAVTEAKIAAIKQAKGFVDGNYDPMRPLWPDPPQQYPYAIDAVFADPRPWTPPGRSDFVDPLGNLYQTQTWTERGQKFLPAKWNNPLQHDYLREGLVRPSTSWAGTIISGSDATTGQPLPQTTTIVCIMAVFGGKLEHVPANNNPVGCSDCRDERAGPRIGVRQFQSRYPATADGQVLCLPRA